MKNKALFSSKDKSKKLRCRLLHFLFGALRDKTSNQGPLYRIITIYMKKWTGKLSLSTQQKMGTFFELGKDKAAKGEGWAPPFISCAEDTVGL